jgi:Chitobiase/beta-hexosaminidase C-terminal domain/Fn3 associated/Bacterial Ig domain
MRINSLKAIGKAAARGAAVLLFGAGLANAQTTVTLTAAPANASLPDGSAVPMWGYTCGAATGGSCAALNPTAGAGIWSPVVITVPYTGPSTKLSITLTNSLPAPVPTSLTIVGQLGGGLGTDFTKKPSPTHNGQGTTWPIANSGAIFTPPAQGDRVQSFGTEVANGATTSTPLTWNALRPGTYLLESGTHPSIQGPMGLYGIVVVTTAPSGPTTPGTAYPSVAYNADVPLIFSEIDPVQNAAVDKAVHTTGFSETAVWSGLPGGCGNPATANTGNCYPPVVNYSPLYYAINGVAFDKTHTAASLFPSSPATGVSGNVLVRMVNAGLRMHVPTIVGAQPSSLSPSAAGTGGFTLVAEDGNVLPGVPRIQSEVFLAAGKSYDVMIKAPTAGTALPVFDRQLSLSGNAIGRDAGMLAYVSVNGAGLPVSNAAAQANPDTYPAVIAGQTLTISDPSKGVLANDLNVFGVKVTTAPTQGSLTLNADGTFTYVAGNAFSGSDTFGYCGNGATSGVTCTTVTLNPAAIESASGISCPAGSFASKLATSLKINAPGVLAGCTDAKGFPLTVNAASVTPASGLTLTVDATGAFKASVASAGTYSFTYKAQNAQGTVATTATNVVLTFPTGSNLQVTVLDGNDKTTTIADYRWIIEEDRTYYVDPNCTQNPLPVGCTASTFNFGTNFHTSFMPLIATGCTGDNSCGANQTVLGVAAPLQTRSYPGDVALDPTKRYYISVLPGDAAQPFINGYAGAPDCSTAGVAAGSCGHGMGGAPIPIGPSKTHSNQAVTILTEPSPYPPATLSALVFEDDYPLNGEIDTGGGIDTISPEEPGLGGFQITIFDNAGGTGDSTGTPTYDMFNMPLSNSLAGTLDPVTKLDACPLSAQSTQASQAGDPSQNGIVGMIMTCPKYESDGKTLSPLAGQVVVKNLWAGRYGVAANAGASRIAAGEEWLQTNTLDGQKAHDSFMRIGEPGYFQEFGPAGYHVVIGFANPKIINDRKTSMCSAAGADCTHEVKGHVTTARMSRTPDERLYGSGNHDAYAFTQCYISLGDPDGADFAFDKCDDQGNFDFTGVPAGNWKITTFDQWDDQVVDGITTAVQLCDPSWTTVSTAPPTGCVPVLDMGEIAVHQWQANIYTRTFLDTDYSGVSTDAKPGLPLVATNIRFRDGSYSNFNNTDLDGYAGFNEVFPLFNWYVVETDTTRFKTTGVHVVYDSGGPDDNTSPNGSACSGASLYSKACGSSSIGANLANTYEPNPLPADLSVPGAAYCPEGADCGSTSIANGAKPSSLTNHSTGRIDPGWVETYGWQGFSGQNSFLEFGKKPFAPGENGGIHGHVIYASTRPFDDPQVLLQLSWEPMIPHVRINLYKEGIADDGVTKTLSLVDHTETSSFDDWAQGVRSDGVPNMNCPGQGTDTSTVADPYFWFALKDQPQWLDLYNNGGTATQPVKHDSQFKCYDGMHNWNQLQPAPYDGMYKFPSILGTNPTTGNTVGTNCTVCVKNPDATDPFRFGKEDMLPDGKYVVEVVIPPGYELVKEEDKNILIGDNFIAPVTQQFGGLGSIFILPDQAEVSSTFNANNPQNPTSNLGRDPGLPSHEADTGSRETYWPCVGALRTVPDYISLFPGSAEVAPFAGEKRNLCDRKEVTLTDQTSALAKFYLFTETHTASHFTGQITDDFAAEFDPFSPAFGEKFAPAYLPVSIKDWAGNEINRVYADAWGVYNGLNYSTWEVNPPNPTGYGPTMMVTCMNDAGPIADPNNPGKTMIDPLFQAGYSDFCYELPFMPGQTGYFDTPVVPTSAFAGGYNTPDCSYPDATPAVSEVDGDGIGPWVSATGKTLTIKALGDQKVDNFTYSGPSANAAPYNQQRVTRHYGFGTQCTAPITGNSTCNTKSSVTIGGIAATVTAWSDAQITVTVPAGTPACSLSQQAIYGGSAAKCGELVVTAGNGKQSVDSVTVTAGGKAPTLLASGQTIQSAIDAAKPGDLIIVPPGTYSEMLLMWKPVRLQGVGAASSIIDGSPHPAGKLNPWRRQIVCLFGLAMNGTPITGTNPYDPSSTFTCTPGMQFSVDRLPLEATVGWDATLNGNLAEQLIEPTLMGAYEGAGITVLGKGVKFPGGQDPFASDVFPTGTQLLTSNDCLKSGTNPFPSNFLCNPSSIDALTVKNSSQGGGGILLHAWNHKLEIANDRVVNNQGTLSGGITVGQGEHPDAFLVGLGATNTTPGSCITNENGLPANLALPYCNNLDVNIHNNLVTQNSSLGDELFSSTPAGAGGVTFCSGSDYYKFNYNWICGNMSTGDGAGVAHLGLSYDGDIEHNTILFNQSTNPTIVTNGGGLLIMGAPDVDPTCGLLTDLDCVPAPTDVPPSDGIGPGLVINANLIMGNSADSGSGGGLRLQHINGTEVLNFPKGNASTNWPSIPGHAAQPAFQKATPWNAVQVTNNIIANNVAGLDGGGVSLLDALAVDVVNNTIVSNNSTASSGVLLQSLFAPLASTQGTNCTANNGSQSCPQVAGLVSGTNTAILKANIGLIAGTNAGNSGTNAITCPTNHGTNRSCVNYSVPNLTNNVLWKNRSLMIAVGGMVPGFQGQNNQVSLYNSGFGTTPTPAANQATTGACDDPHTSYWDLGVHGDAGPGNHASGYTLSPTYSVLTNNSTLAESADSTNIYSPATVLGSIYCNGSRLPVEAVVAAGVYGWQVPPGTNESNALPAPPFTLAASATVDEGNNWINLRWGPLTTNFANPQTGLPVFSFDPSLPVNSVAIDKVPVSVIHPTTDFFGNPRPDGSGGNTFDIGAIESLTTSAPLFSLAGGTYHSPQTLILTDVTPGAIIYFTTDGSTPTALSTKYTAPITIASTETVKAIAIAPGFYPSPVSSKAYVYVPLPPAAAPFFSLAGGTYNSPQTLMITDSTPNSTIHYTTNGSTPTTLSTVYNGPITIASTETVKAIATAPGFDISPVSTKSYTYVPLSPTAAPSFSLAGGTYTTPQSLTLTDTTPGAVIHYTTNGSAPTANSTTYAGPITVASTETVKAIAIAPGFLISSVSSKAYTYNPLPQAAAPAFSLAGGHYTTAQTLTLTDSTPGATIYYTTNGSTPTTNSTKYTGPITINTNELVRAIAVAPGYNNSNPSAKGYVIP